ncbi:MAG: hypothetical protein AMJ70_08390, partial [Dehalococcoidia bacterium SG8_51_3]
MFHKLELVAKLPFQGGMGIEKSIERRVEQIKCLSNLKFQLLKSIYGDNESSLGELYMNGESILNVHGLIGKYRFCATLRNTVNNGGISNSQFPMLVWVRQSS